MYGVIFAKKRAVDERLLFYGILMTQGTAPAAPTYVGAASPTLVLDQLGEGRRYKPDHNAEEGDPHRADG